MKKGHAFKKGTADLLAITQRQLQHLLKASSAVIYNRQPYGHYAMTFVSDNIRAQLGYAPQDFLNDPKFWLRHVHPEDREQVLAELTALPQQTELCYEYRFQHRAGDYRWIHEVLQLSCDQAGRPLEIAGYWLDITERKHAEEALREHKEFLRTILDRIPMMIARFDVQGQLQWVNQEWEQILGWSLEKAKQRDILAELYPDPDYRQCVLHFICENHLQWQEFHTQAHDGRVRETAWINMKFADGSRIEIGQDLTERRLTKEALHASEARLQNIASHLPGYIFRRVRTAENCFTYEYVSGAARTLFGLAPQALIADPSRWWSLLPPEDRKAFAAALERSAKELSPLDKEYRIQLANGQIRWMRSIAHPHLRSGNTVYWDGIGLDVTAQKHTEAQLNYLAYHDSLTDLPNRKLFEDRLHQAVAQAQRGKHAFALHHLDLDDFKAINDTQGHHIGDALLKVVGERLRQKVRQSDTVARLGGDEFAIIQSDLSHPDQAAVLAHKLIIALSQPFHLEGETLHVSVSDGIVVYPELTEATPVRTALQMDGGELLKRADIALYEAKQAGRDTFRFFRQGMEIPTQRRVTLREALHQALIKEEFQLHYQPLVHLTTGKIIGAEALIRWSHPALGLQRPDRFIPIAEEAGLIIPIGAWVLQEACAQAMAWQRQGLPTIRVAVNISAIQIRRSSLIDTVRETLENTGLEPSCLELELTESTLATHSEEMICFMQELKKLGVNLAIDDFGTGYSSFQYLKAFSLDKLKIDRTFIRDITTDAGDAAIIRAIIAVGRSLHLDVVAEGIEIQEQWDFLHTEGCVQGQGYYFSMPLMAEDFAWLLKEDLSFPISQAPSIRSH